MVVNHPVTLASIALAAISTIAALFFDVHKIEKFIAWTSKVEIRRNHDKIIVEAPKPDFLATPKKNEARPVTEGQNL